MLKIPPKCLHIFDAAVDSMFFFLPLFIAISLSNHNQHLMANSTLTQKFITSYIQLQIRHPRPKALQQSDSLTECRLEHIALLTDDIDTSVNDLKANGVKFVQPIVQMPMHRLPFFIAPENVLVELMEPKK
jgi:phosphotransferase system  glucose/maltose/N-acetylglucosamine-specific IIC component